MKCSYGFVGDNSFFFMFTPDKDDELKAVDELFAMVNDLEEEEEDK